VDEKNIWMYLFFAMLLICVVLSVLQVRTTSESDYRKKYDDLKRSYLELARTQSKILGEMMLKTETLKENNPDYKDLEKDELDKRVRRDIGRLEIRIDELEKER
jgi:K+/H+ antiporter YhaU regulatory subunit KhtT